MPTINESELNRLLDNRYVIQIHRQVDGKYCAAAKRPWREKWSDIFQTVNQQGVPCGFPQDEFERKNYRGPAMPHRICVADTPEDALRGLADSVLNTKGTEQ